MNSSILKKKKKKRKKLKKKEMLPANPTNPLFFQTSKTLLDFYLADLKQDLILCLKSTKFMSQLHCSEYLKPYIIVYKYLKPYSGV